MRVEDCFCACALCICVCISLAWVGLGSALCPLIVDRSSFSVCQHWKLARSFALGVLSISSVVIKLFMLLGFDAIKGFPLSCIIFYFIFILMFSLDQ